MQDEVRGEGGEGLMDGEGRGKPGERKGEECVRGEGRGGYLV